MKNPRAFPEDVGERRIVAGEAKIPDALPAVVSKDAAYAIVVSNIKSLHLLSRIFNYIGCICQILT